jgi:alpha-ribazole phosphatase
MAVIDFLRHGLTDRPGDLVGVTDTALTEEGWRQIERQTAGRRWDAIITSPLKRAREGAERVGAARGVAVEIEPDWREIDLGDWDGKPWAELRADRETAERIAEFYRNPLTGEPPNGESFAMLQDRVSRALERLVDQRGATLVMAHAGPIRTALSLATGLSLSSLWAIRIEPATRVRVELGRHPEHGLAGEIVEIAPP